MRRYLALALWAVASLTSPHGRGAGGDERHQRESLTLGMTEAAKLLNKQLERGKN